MLIVASDGPFHVHILGEVQLLAERGQPQDQKSQKSGIFQHKNPKICHSNKKMAWKFTTLFYQPKNPAKITQQNTCILSAMHIKTFQPSFDGSCAKNDETNWNL